MPEVTDIRKFYPAERSQTENTKNLHMPQFSFKRNNYVQPSTSKHSKHSTRFTSPSSQKAVAFLSTQNKPSAHIKPERQTGQEVYSYPVFQSKAPQD